MERGHKQLDPPVASLRGVLRQQLVEPLPDHAAPDPVQTPRPTLEGAGLLTQCESPLERQVHVNVARGEGGRECTCAYARGQWAGTSMAVWELGSGDLERCCESALLERGVWSFGVALPALAPQHGTVERSMRLESEVMAPACHQKKIPPPGNTSRAGALITIAVAELALSWRVVQSHTSRVGFLNDCDAYTT